MFDVALASAGAQVVLVSSADENYPPENIIDGKSETFWISTGLFPQEFVITFQSMMNINSITMDSYNVKTLAIESSVQNEPLDFEPAMELKELENTDNQLQQEDFRLNNVKAQHLRFSIPAAYDHFVSVHTVHVDGNAVHS